MTKQRLEEYDHQPRKNDKKKRHRRGFNEETQDSRAQRVNFKRYIREIEEQQLEEFDEEFDEEDDYINKS